MNQATTDTGTFPLYVASHDGHLDVVRLLVSMGADVNQQDNQKRTALHAAAKKGHVDVTKLLVDTPFLAALCHRQAPPPTGGRAAGR